MTRHIRDDNPDVQTFEKIHRGGNAGARDGHEHEKRGYRPTNDKNKRSFPEMTDTSRTTPATPANLQRLQQTGVGGAQGALREKAPSPYCPICGNRKNLPLEGREPFVVCSEDNKAYIEAARAHQAALGSMSADEKADAIFAGTLNLGEVRPPTVTEWALGVVTTELDRFEQEHADSEEAYKPFAEQVRELINKQTHGERVDDRQLFHAMERKARALLDAEHGEGRVVTDAFYAFIRARGRYFAAYEFIDRCRERGVKPFVPVAKTAEAPAPETPAADVAPLNDEVGASDEAEERMRAEAHQDAELAAQSEA